MNGTHIRLAVLVALSALALVACGGASATSPVGTNGGGDDAAFAALGNGNATPPAGDGVCDGCDGTCDGTGPHGPQNGNGHGDGTCDGSGPGAGDGTCTCDGAGPGAGDGTCTCACTETGPDPEDLETLLVDALQEEYLAEWTYRRVLSDLGPDTMPFSVIAESEGVHVQAIVALFEKRGFAAPASTWGLGNVEQFGTLSAACAGGVAIELDDVALYGGLLARGDLPCDAAQVFTSLRLASLEHHLPAFERCQ